MKSCVKTKTNKQNKSEEGADGCLAVSQAVNLVAQSCGCWPRPSSLASRSVVTVPSTSLDPYSGLLSTNTAASCSSCHQRLNCHHSKSRGRGRGPRMKADGLP